MRRPANPAVVVVAALPHSGLRNRDHQRPVHARGLHRSNGRVAAGRCDGQGERRDGRVEGDRDDVGGRRGEGEGAPGRGQQPGKRAVGRAGAGRPPPPTLAGWKDTVFLPPGTTVRILVRFTDYTDPALPYMFHCHLLRHEDSGMMGQFVVVQPGQAPASSPTHHHR